MSFNFKVIIVSFLIIIAMPMAGFWYYKKHSRPKYTPPLSKKEINITIIPGWNLRDIAKDWMEKNIIKDETELYALLGEPAYNYKARRKDAPVVYFESMPAEQKYPLLSTKPNYVSYEGYLFPDTYRVYTDAKPEDILKKVFSNLEDKITSEMREEIVKQKKSFFEILNMAALVEREAKTSEDMAMVADIFWRREKMNWALQSCASVNYITGKNDPGVLDVDRAIDSAFNTYKYPGLPLGPVGNPSMKGIAAVLYPQKNTYWYFMSGTDGTMHYARTLEGHNINVAKFLK